MKIEVWSDIHCPWCYIGKRRLEAALERFAGRDEVEIEWRSHQLDPQAPREYPGTIDDLLVRKYGMTAGQAKAMHERVTALAAAEGLDYRFDRVRPGNSLDAHRVLQLAKAQGKGGAIEERLMRAYFTEGRHLSDREELIKLAAEVGLEASAVRDMLASDRFVDAVRADAARGAEFGLRGVPFFVIDEKYGVSGAQDVEVFLRTLQRAHAPANGERAAAG